MLSERQKQILACMELEVLYKTEEIAEKIGLKGPRTRQLLNELVPMENRRNFIMRKNFEAKPWFYPLPVLIIGTYDEDGTPDAMNAAWGGLYERGL